METPPHGLLAVAGIALLAGAQPSAGYVAAFRLFATTAAWSCRSLTDGKVLVAVRVATIVLAGRTLARELLARHGSPSLTRAHTACPAPQSARPARRLDQSPKGRTHDT
ncbi:hypothetical protein [Streptomyces sp. SID3343]|uniref:hypothetical protein n=1 Tax=Streptomyces sp. SID3343 TaxID=2690260 RepID=UPI0013715085|nr:hypothetical protein [Streptomyces sp. SID3343]MYW03520.1 hypothetical protein [Streptomyces sp. SID3343]